MIGYAKNDGGRAASGRRGQTGDCVVRAIAILTGADYDRVYNDMAAAMKAAGFPATGDARRTRGPKAWRVQQNVLESYGLEKIYMPARSRKPTYTEAYEKYGNCVVKTTRHLAAIRDGKLQDIADSRLYLWDGGYAGTIRERSRKATSIWILSRKSKEEK